MQCKHRGKRGFSLVELMAVIAVIVVMMTLMTPAISGFSSTAGRRGAVNVLMNAFEQSRVSALEAGRDIFVVMHRNPSMDGQDSFMIFRDDTKADLPQDQQVFVQVSKWQKLPKGIMFYKANGSLTASGVVPNALKGVKALNDIPAGELFCISFNRHGQVASPKNDLSLYIAEATRGENGDAVRKGASINITERLSFRRFTGRAQLDFSSQPQS